MRSLGSMSRRDALATLGVLACTLRTGFAAPAAAKPGIALQMYTLRDPAKKDLADTLKKVKEMGWEYIQWSGMPNLPADKIRAALDTAGLKAIACHTGVEPFEKSFDEQVAFWKTVGTKYVGPGGMMKDCKDTLQDWLKGCKRFDALGEKLSKVGMCLTYHNHAWELEKYTNDPRSKLDLLLENTRPEYVYAEFDLAWLYAGGVDPAAYIRKYKGRCPTVHAKDAVVSGEKKKAQLKPLGKGALDWKGIFAAGAESGVQWYIYEQDSGEGSPFDYTQASFEFLKKNLP